MQIRACDPQTGAADDDEVKTFRLPRFMLLVLDYAGEDTIAL